MLTALGENNKKKADQYWPDEQNKTQTISDSIELGRFTIFFGSPLLFPIIFFIR